MFLTGFVGVLCQRHCVSDWFRGGVLPGFLFLTGLMGRYASAVGFQMEFIGC